MPDAIPVIIPDRLPAVAVDAALLAQVPPGLLSPSVTDEPIQTAGMPEMELGKEFTVIVVDTVQPAPRE